LHGKRRYPVVSGLSISGDTSTTIMLRMPTPQAATPMETPTKVSAPYRCQFRHCLVDNPERPIEVLEHDRIIDMSDNISQ
jgi:hypothetical protein